MKKYLYILIPIIFLILVSSISLSYIFEPTGKLFTGLIQIFSGILGGIIALVGVIWTLKKQQEENNKEWKHQLELSKKEWKVQDERYREDWRIKAQPWFKFHESNLGETINLHIYAKKTFREAIFLILIFLFLLINLV